jgi:hypothetical protein
MVNKKGASQVLLNPQIILVIAGILAGYVFAPNLGLDSSFGALFGGLSGFILSRYL